MSGTDRDQRARPHSGKSCPDSINGGCPWCKTGDAKLPLRRAVRRAGKAIAREEDRS